MSTYEVGPPVSVTGPAVVILHAALPTMTVPAGHTSPISVSTQLPASTSRPVIGIQRIPTSMGGGAAAGGPAVTPAASAVVSQAQAAESTSTTTHTNTETRIMTLQRAAAGTGNVGKRPV